MTVLPQPRAPRAALSRLNLPKDFEPAWEIAALFPAQGEWTEEDYLALDGKLEAAGLIELVDGRIEVLPVPTEEHQIVLLFLLEALLGFVRPRQLGKVLFAGLRVRLRSRLFRLPDVVFLGKRNAGKRGNKFWTGADLVMEVVSPHDPARDYVKKRAHYAKAGIREYWIVDPRDRTISLLVLKGKTYAQYGVYRDGEQVVSVLLRGFSVDVSAVFDAARE